MPQLDLATLALASLGLVVAVSFAVLAGTVSARVFFDATRAPNEDDASSAGARSPR